MGLILFALFVGIPLAEIALFVTIGGQIGVLPTIAIVILTAIAGAWLVRLQGLETLNRARADIDRNVMPTGAMSEGLAILVAGAFLLTPGFLTDTIGFALLIPPARRSIIRWIGGWLAARVTVVNMDGRGGYSGATYSGGAYPGGEASHGGRGKSGDIIDGEFTEIDPDTEEDPDDRGPRTLGQRGKDSPWSGS